MSCSTQSRAATLTEAWKCRLGGRAVGCCVGYVPAEDTNRGVQDVAGNECLVL